MRVSLGMFLTWVLIMVTVLFTAGPMAIIPVAIIGALLVFPFQ